MSSTLIALISAGGAIAGALAGGAAAGAASVLAVRNQVKAQQKAQSTEISEQRRSRREEICRSAYLDLTNKVHESEKLLRELHHFTIRDETSLNRLLAKMEDATQLMEETYAMVTVIELEGIRGDGEVARNLHHSLEEWLGALAAGLTRLSAERTSLQSTVSGLDQHSMEVQRRRSEFVSAARRALGSEFDDATYTLPSR
ncbi:hypothetical protein [Streptomyces sp. NPDC058228]|uniref:hypothetical protein n=1 Tax=Streptomyces sp. NPDC058228 TaxID=3346390 RepID=UPI0036EACA1B